MKAHRMRSNVITALLAGLLALAGCQGGPASAPVATTKPPPSGVTLIASPDAWGGQVRCAAGGCKLVLVEHEQGQLVVHRLEGRAVQPLARHELAYHPDSAAWLTDELVVAAVEGSSGLDIFRLDGERLVPVQQIQIGTQPRDVVVLPAAAGAGAPGSFDLLATPYGGDQAIWVTVVPGSPTPAVVQRTPACRTPWHPAPVARAPGRAQAGVAVGCLDDKRVMWMPRAAPHEPAVELARFKNVPRQVRPSPTGKWLYVALELGGYNARIDMDSGEIQHLTALPTGNVAVAPLADDLVIWGDSWRLMLQRLDARGQVLETRWLPTTGFSTSVQLIDVDGDGELDAVVLNSAGPTSDVIYGPLWQRAGTQRP